MLVQVIFMNQKPTCTLSDFGGKSIFYLFLIIIIPDVADFIFYVILVSRLFESIAKRTRSKQSVIACVACSQHQNGGIRNFLNLSLCISPFSLGYKRGKMYKEWNQHYLQISHFIYLYIFIYLSV